MLSNKKPDTSLVLCCLQPTWSLLIKALISSKPRGDTASLRGLDCGSDTDPV